VPEAGRLDQTRSLPGAGDRDAVPQWYLGVLAVVDDEEGRRPARGEGRDVELVPTQADPPLAAPPHPVDHVGRDAEPRDEAPDPCRGVGGWCEEHEAPDGEAVARREHGGRGSQRVGHNARGSSDRVDHRPQRARELGRRGETSPRAAVARGVERHDGEPAADERSDERRELRRTSTPAVEQDDDRPATPPPRCEATTPEGHLQPLPLLEQHLPA
jgi:hypothetical protein